MTREQKFFNDIHWELLQDQKNWLLYSINFDTDEDELYSQGLVELIDSIQDYAVDELGMDENVVFNFSKEE